MPATKIINVSRDDEFEEVFDLFKSAEADEIIFIFPRGSRFAKQERYFEALRDEADLLGRRVSIMTTDPFIVQFASQYGFDVLGARDSGRGKWQTEAPDEQPSVSEETASETELPTPESPIYDEPAYPVYEEAESIQPETILAAARANESGGDQGRIIKDIFPSKTGRSLEVNGERERALEVDIKSYIGRRKDQMGEIEKIWAEERQKERHNFFANSARKLKSRRLFKKIPFFLVIGAVLVLVLVLYSTLGSAKIVIRPQKQKLDFKLKVSASSAATAINFDFNQIPGQHFKDQREESGTFPATGQKDVIQKAGGEITISSKSSVAQRLVATTRFKTPDGLIFRIPQTVVVPPATKTGSTITPGSVKSPVYADRPGAEYNIAPTQFTIPGLEGTPKFSDFYAVSDKPMTGGIIGPAKVVTEEDFTKAQESLTEKVKNEIPKSLKNQSGELKILDTLAIKLEMPKTNAKVGDAVENLQMTIKGSADTTAFREADIVELIKNFVSKKDNLELLSKDLIITYQNPTASTDNILLSFDVQISGWAAAKIDKNAILENVAGMSNDSVRSYFSNSEEVESVRVILSPFWVKNIPKDPERIKINIETE